MFNYIFFDGSISTMGNLLWALEQKKYVWIIMNHATQNLKGIIHDIVLCSAKFHHKNNGKLIQHISNDVKNVEFISVLNPEEMFFKIICEKTQTLQKIILSETKICTNEENDELCKECENCVNCNLIANEYGIYDILE